MYEDAEIERVAFHGKGRVFSIASAGATALRLADQHEVVACDINPAQLAYAERRAAGATAGNGRRRAGDECRARVHAACGLEGRACARLPCALRCRRTDPLLEDASRHTPLPRRF